MAKSKKRNTELNMYPVEEALPIVHNLFAKVRAKGISMRKLCEVAGVHHDVVGRWRRAETAPNLRTMDRLLTALDSVDDESVAA